MSFARHLDEVGRREKAVAILAPIHSSFTEGFAAPDTVAAKSLRIVFGDDAGSLLVVAAIFIRHSMMLQQTN